MNTVSIGEYHGLRVGSALLSIVSGCIIIGVSKDCDADAVGGIFLGAGGLGLLIAVYPFIKAWFNVHHILPNIGNFRVHPVAPTPAPEQPTDSLRREGTVAPLERSRSRMGTFAEAGAAEGSQDDGINDTIKESSSVRLHDNHILSIFAERSVVFWLPSPDVPDILGRRKPKPSDADLP